jgi:hypothetical protein
MQTRWERTPRDVLNSLHFSAFIEQLQRGCVPKAVNDVESVRESRSSNFKAAPLEGAKEEAELRVGAPSDPSKPVPIDPEQTRSD